MVRQSRPKSDGSRNRGGRPRLIDQPCPSVPGKTYGEAIVDLVRDGNPLVIAARSSGISERALMLWRAEGRDGGDPRYVQFLQDCDAAEAESVVRLVQVLREAATGDPYEVVRTVSKHVRGEDGQIVPVVEQTVTRGVRRYPKTAEWLLTRRAPEHFAPQPVQLPAGGGTVDGPVSEEAQTAAQRQWDAYLQGIRDSEASRAEKASEGP